ncbi:MAG TPA: Wzz/FepE/Etk N-terminal domain-containing protein [Terracidiphilus sp.]|nr:Wzz/FepE/Etk N-terminal domain-containing protein [Terracidiphilus sp.]
MAIERGQIVLEPEVDAPPLLHALSPVAPNWVVNAAVLWDHRRTLMRIAAIALAVSLILAFVIPKRYQSTARIMPPESGNSGSAMLAALAGRSLGGLEGIGALAASFLGAHGNSALYVELLKSGTVTGDLIDRFDLQKAYGKRYRVDTVKYLLRHTTVAEDKKSGVITVTVTDTDPTRARDLAQGYLDELNKLLNRTSTSSARRERTFIEKRLASVHNDLENAQQALSDFSSTHSTIDIREQGRAMVEAGAKLQGQLIATQGELDSLRQIYGDGNVRVRSAQVRIADLKKELARMGGTSAQLPTASAEAQNDHAGDTDLYPPLRQLPRLAVPYTDLYRTVKVQETVFELLTQQHEIARIQEAKDIPVVSVIDSPGIPEKKSFPPRTLLTLGLTLLVIAGASGWFLFNDRWTKMDPEDPRKVLAQAMLHDMRSRGDRFGPGQVRE